MNNHFIVGKRGILMCVFMLTLVDIVLRSTNARTNSGHAVINNTKSYSSNKIGRVNVTFESDNSAINTVKRGIKKKKDKSKPSHLSIVNPGTASLKYHLDILSTRQYPKAQRPKSCINCNHFNFSTITLPKYICSGNGTIDLLVLVTTIPKAVDSRQMIRNTWLQHSNRNTVNVRHVFLLGSGWSREEQAVLDKEGAQYGDILQEDYKDAYYNLSMKMMSGYKWALKFCNKAKFTLRTADDNYINIPEVVNWINANGHKNMHVQIGRKIVNMRVYRRRDNKWFVSDLEYPGKVYPPYASGTAFLFSKVALKDIIEAAPNVPFFSIEDVWFGLIMQQIKMPVVNLPGIDAPLGSLNNLLNGKCPNSGKFLSIHMVSPKAMELIWQQCLSKYKLKN